MVVCRDNWIPAVLRYVCSADFVALVQNEFRVSHSISVLALQLGQCCERSTTSSTRSRL